MDPKTSPNASRNASQNAGGSTPEATPAEMIKSSFAALEPRAPEVVDRFYDRLFTAAPGVRPLFPEDMSGQKKHLLGAIGLVVKNADRLETLREPLEQMGERHVGYGAKAEHYPVVRDTLLATLAEFAGPLWTSAMAGAWAGAINGVTGYMLEGAGQNAGEPEAGTKRRAA
ncbi:MAG: globin domain-containing protein [Phycisphaerales bacterium]